MREIKFRAWDGYTKTMIRNTINDYLSIDDDGELNTQSILNTIIPLQYTGLKDKNGVEIYEGDIVRHQEHQEYVFKYVFSEGRFIAIQLTKYSGQQRWYFSQKDTQRKIEVIGNIYEHPKLLEV